MNDTEPNEFTEREKFILSYFRAQESGGSRRNLGYSLAFVIASIACAVYAVVLQDEPLAFVAYALLLGRLYYLSVEGGRFAKDYQSIFKKYDAKLRALTEALKKSEEAGT